MLRTHACDMHSDFVLYKRLAFSAKSPDAADGTLGVVQCYVICSRVGFTEYLASPSCHSYVIFEYNMR